MPEYSYYFVLRGYRKVLESLGDVVVVQNPALQVDPLYEESCQRGTPCVFISFSPPNKTIASLRCPTISVFAWEFSNIPYEVWDGDARHDWRVVLKQLGRSITLSTHTAHVVRQALGDEFAIAAIPVPVYAPAAAADVRLPPLAARSLAIGCTAIDSRFYEVGSDTFSADIPPEFFQLRDWYGEPIELDFKLGDEGSGFLGGFYESEQWGTWSRIADPWVLLPIALVGHCKLGVELTSYGANVGTEIQVAVGEQRFPLALTNDFLRTEFVCDIRQPVNLIQFIGLDVSGISGARDPRSLGIGLRKIWLEGNSSTEPAVAKKKLPLQLALEGVVYTSVLNPGDDRKNWLEMLTAFCYAFRSEPRATLILKMTHRSVGAFLGQFHYTLQRIGHVECRVIILHGYLEDDAYQQLIDISTYCVNSSRCEGLCLPLMEFMSCGVPAVAPCHTAMEDYIDADNAFIVQSSLEPGIWPHDTRALYRTLRYRINWSSLVDAFRASFRVACDDSAKYAQMSSHARDAQRRFSSHDVVRQQLSAFLRVGDGNDATADVLLSSRRTL
ncbi:MAG TPA: glycosyltransferase [Spongiibacteraceae bacterium]|nr:glycosyltransferase [Spongiibacteraceae bacterium]